MEISERACEYLQEEQKQRRREIETLSARIESDQTRALIVTGVIWSWLATNWSFDKASACLIVILPPILMLFFFYRHFHLIQSIFKIAEYTRYLENQFNVPEGLGWESWLDMQRKKKRDVDPLLRNEWTFWIALIAVNSVPFLLLLPQLTK